MTAAQSSGGVPAVRSVGRVLGRFARSLFSGGSTPARLRLWLGVTAVVAVLFAVLGAFGVGRRESSLADARDAAQQLIEVQDVQVRLVHADALASENYLRGGTEDAASRLLYEAELQAVSSGLVTLGNQVAGAQAQQLAIVSGQLGEYAGLVEQARANNRQGYPVGAAYLRTANSAATEMTEVLREVQAALRQQVNAGLDRADSAGVWLHLLGWPLVLLLAVGGGWVALRFRRLVNLPLAAAFLGTVLVVLIGGTMQGSSLSEAEAATSGPLRSADLASQARVAAFDAHTQESLALINRGNADETLWSAGSDVVGVALTQLCSRSDQCPLQTGYEQYGQMHLQVRQLDDAGDWDAARELSLGAAGESFASFAAESSDVAQAYTSSAVSELSGSSAGLGGLRVVVFIAGLAVAALAIAGYGQRLREYR